MNKEISAAFTIEDIHAIREDNYERTKDLTTQEKIKYYNSLGKKAEEEIEKRKMVVSA